MDAQDILKSLKNLEQSLQNVEAARQQVTNTVKAYESTRTQLHALTDDFSTISSELTNVITLINSNQKSIDNTLKKNIEEVFTKINNQIGDIEESVSGINNSFKETCKSTSKSITSSVDESVTKLNNEIEKSLQKFNEKAKLEIDGITNVISGLKKSSNEIQTGYQQSISSITINHKTTQLAIIDNFKKSLEESLAGFDSQKDELKNIIANFNPVLDVIFNDIKNELFKIITKTSSLSSEIQTLNTDISHKYDDIVYKLKSIHDNNVNTCERFNNVDRSFLDIKQSFSKSSDLLDNALALILKEQKKQIETANNAISSKIESLNGNVDSNSREVRTLESEVKTLKTEVESLSTEVEDSKKLSQICLIVIVISLILNIILIAR